MDLGKWRNGLLATACGLTVVALLILTAAGHRTNMGATAYAQGSEGIPAFQGGFGQGPGGPGFQGPPGGMGGFMQRMPFVMGTVVEIDKNTNTLYVEGFFGNEQQVKVTSATKIVTQTTAKAADLKPGDRIQVQGVPTGIAANSVSIGEMPEGLNFRGPGGQRGQGAQGGGQRGGGMFGMGSFATATGTVKAVNPLTVAVSDTVTVTVRLASDARLTKIVPTTFANIKEDDRVMVAGSAGQDGVFNATAIAVNVGGPGMFGPGMGPGGGRPGGPPGGGQPPARR